MRKEIEAKSTHSILTDSTIHGVHFIANTKISKFERIFWTGAIVSATVGAIILVISNFEHFWANPTVVSIKKDFRNWENAFPAATACFLDRMDEFKASMYVQKEWNISQTDENYKFYIEFIKAVSNISYSNLKVFEKFQNNSILAKVDMTQLATQVHPDIEGTLVTFQTKRKPIWQLVLTERGLCFTINSKFAKLFSPSYTNEQDNLIETDLLSCHYLNGLCYARYDSDPEKTISYYIHSSLDIIHATSDAPWVLREGEELEVNFEMIETSSSPDIRYLSPGQRECRFDNEPLRPDSRVYSMSVCYAFCRYKLAIKYCGCKPFFYKYLEGETCDINGLVCLSKYLKMFNKPPQEVGCMCPQPCDLVVYLKQPPKLTKWENSLFDQRITFRWGLLPPTTKYNRNIFFGFQDLLVSFGGILSLFLGISFLTILETIFLLGELFWNYVKSMLYTSTKNTQIL